MAGSTSIHGENSLGASQSSHKQSSQNTSTLIDEDVVQEFINNTAPISAEKDSSVIPLKFDIGNSNSTPTFDAMNPHLTALEDEHSSYLSVSKACLFLNQLGSYGSSSETPPSPDVIESNLFQAEEYVTNFSRILNTLMSTSSNHFDRRCRILALQSLSLISKAVVAKLVTTAIFLDHNDVALITRLQDEICNDVVINMVSCGLEDDDGVTAVAFEALGRLVIDLNDDLFTREVREITGQFTPMAYEAMEGLFEQEERSSWDDQIVSAGGSQDIDGLVYNSEIRFRILKSVLAPRIRIFLNRIQLLKTTENRLRCLPFLNEVVIFVRRLKKRGETQPNDEETFAIRWYELDTDTMVQEYVDFFLTPLLEICQCTGGAYSGSCIENGVVAATNVLMLCSVGNGNEGWLEHVIPLTIHNLEMGLQYAMSYGTLEELINRIGTLLVALRGVDLEMRRDILENRVVPIVADLPSTRILSEDTITASLHQSNRSQRKPTRIGFWTEIALSLLRADRTSMDSIDKEYLPGHYKTSTQVRNLSLFLRSPVILSLINLKENRQNSSGACVLHPTEEIVYSFCSVANSIGKTLIFATTADNGDTLINIPLGLEKDVWVGAALELLRSFISCLGWKDELQTIGERRDYCSILFAAQKSYIELLRSVLVHAGSIVSSSSIYYHFVLSITNIDYRMPSMDSSPLRNVMVEDEIAIILDRVMGQFAATPITSRKIRLSLLCLLTDAWIQQCQQSIFFYDRSQRDENGPVDLDDDMMNMNEPQAQNLLSFLGTEISSLIFGAKNRASVGMRHSQSDNPVNVAGEELRSLLACIACVESIAYTSQLSANHLASTKGNVDEEESARYLVSVSMVVLKGQGKIEADCNDNDTVEADNLSDASTSHGSTAGSPFRSPRSKSRITAFTSECADAAKRLRRFVGLNDDGSDNENTGPVSIDFSCPLLKRPNFGIPIDNLDSQETAPYSQVNDQWKVDDRMISVDCDHQCGALIGVSPHFLIDSGRRLDKNNFESGILLHICRQQVSLQTLHTIQSCSYNEWKSADSEVRCRRREFLLRLPEFRPRSLITCERNFQNREVVLEAMTGCSDPLSVSLTYSVRRQPRYDSETCNFISVITMQIYNVTPVSVLRGLHLKLILSPKCGGADTIKDHDEGLCMIDSIFSNELSGGQCLTWEVLLDSSRVSNHTIRASVSMRDIETDIETIVSLAAINDETSTHHDENKDTSCGMRNVNFSDIVDFRRTTIASSLLLPNPHVFFFGRNVCDEKAFIFLWQNMPHSIALHDIPTNEAIPSIFPCFTDASMFDLGYERGQQYEAWALTSWTDDKHLLAIRLKPGNGGSSRFSIKSNDLQLLEQMIS